MQRSSCLLVACSVLLLIGEPLHGASFQDYMQRVEELPVRFNGREITFRDYAEQLVDRLSSGRGLAAEDGPTPSPSRCVLDLFARHRDGERARILYVELSLAQALGLETGQEDEASAHSLAALWKHGRTLQELAEQGGEEASEADELLRNIVAVRALSRSHPRPLRREEGYLRTAAWNIDLIRQLPIPRLVPPPAEEWVPWGAFIDRMWVSCTVPGAADDPALEELVALLDAHRRRHVDEVLQALDRIEARIAALDPAPRRALRFEVPAGWDETGIPLDEEPMGFDDIRAVGLRTMSFGAANGVQGGIVHVVGPTLSDGAFWQSTRIALGRAPGTEEDTGHLRQLPVAGSERYVLDATSPECASSPHRDLATLVRRGDHTFVITMTGSPAAVEAQVPAFESFLASLVIGDPADIERWTGLRWMESEPGQARQPPQVAVAAIPWGDGTRLLTVVPYRASPGEARQLLLNELGVIERSWELAGQGLEPPLRERSGPGPFILLDSFEAMDPEQLVELVVLEALSSTPLHVRPEMLRERVEWMPFRDAEIPFICIEPGG